MPNYEYYQKLVEQLGDIGHSDGYQILLCDTYDKSLEKKQLVDFLKECRINKTIPSRHNFNFIGFCVLFHKYKDNDITTSTDAGNIYSKLYKYPYKGGNVVDTETIEKFSNDIDEIFNMTNLVYAINYCD